METVSGAIGMSLPELRESLVKLAAGGVIRQSYDKQLSVCPEPLRYVLVRDVFFSGVCDLPYNEIASKLDDKYALIKTLLGAINRGAVIPEITSLLESIKSPILWKQYASLGQKEADFVLVEHPEEITSFASVGEETLEHVPEKTLPVLFEAAIGDRRALGNALNHPLRWVQDWILHAESGGKGEAIQRRMILINAIKDWLAKGGDQDVGMRALSLAFSPGFKKVTPDPGSGNNISLVRAPLGDSELSQLLKLWSEATPLLETLRFADWQDLLNTVHEWFYPELVTYGDVPQAKRKIMRDHAKQLVTDILAVSKDRSGIQQWGRKLSRELGIDIEFSVEREFEILFPKFERREWEQDVDKQQKAVIDLAEEWWVKTPSEIASVLLRLEREATVQHTWPRWSPTLCGLIAEKITEVNQWLSCFIEAQLPGDLCLPFLLKAVRGRVHGWDESVAKCLQNPLYEWVAVNTLITENNLPTDLLNNAFQSANKYPDMIFTACLRNQVPETTLKAMLSLVNTDVSTQAAMGTWWADPRGEINEGIATEWRAAILRAHGAQFFSSEILEADKELAFDWLISRLDEKRKYFDFHTRKEISAAISALDSEQRLAALVRVPDDGLLTFELLTDLTSDDLKVCEEVLRTSRFGQLRLIFLHAHPKGIWPEKALLALDAGISAQDIIHATLHEDESWTGGLSNMWQGWIDDFTPLLAHDDARIQSLAQIAIDELKSCQSAARKSERRAAVYGR